jgi:YesN/AraC family two-component response regulator
MEIVDILHQLILFFISDSEKMKGRTNKYYPIYSENSHWAIQEIENYIIRYYDKDISLSQMANLYFLNEQYLCRLFKKKKGINFSDYVNRIRLDKAKQLLASSDNKIINISMQLGFNNVSYFNRLFKKYFGLTPSQYKRNT